MKPDGKSHPSPVCRSGCYMPHLCNGAGECQMIPKKYYPLFADLSGRLCVVIGGGKVAERKVISLLRSGACVTVVSPALTKRLSRYAASGSLRHVARRFRTSDLRGAWLVFAATDEPMINERIFRASVARRLFVNVVDQTPLCTFIAPAILKRGPLTVAVSTGGLSPSLAKKLRDEVDRLVGSRYAPMLRLLGELRGAAKRRMPRYGDRKKYFDRLVRGRVFALVRSGKEREAAREAAALMERCARKKR